MCELAEGESAEVHIESHDLIRCSLDSRIDEILQLSFAQSEPSPSSIPLAVRRYSAGRDIGGSGHEPRSRLGIVQSPLLRQQLDCSWRWTSWDASMTVSLQFKNDTANGVRAI